MKIESVDINLKENSYQIDIGDQYLTKETLSGLLENKEVILVYDKKINISALEDIQTSLKTLSREFTAIGIEASEENKSFDTVNNIHNLLLEKGLSRECILVGLGGGIVGDLSGFAAATYQRGVDFILIPLCS